MWYQHDRAARVKMAAAGVSAKLVPSHQFRSGIEHRRVIWAHAKAHNPQAWTRLTIAFSHVVALHLLLSDVVEFRTAEGLLVGLALYTQAGR